MQNQQTDPLSLEDKKFNLKVHRDEASKWPYDYYIKWETLRGPQVVADVALPLLLRLRRDVIDF